MSMWKILWHWCRKFDNDSIYCRFLRAVEIRVICWLSICWIRISKQIMSAERIGEKQMRMEKSLYD